MAPQSAQLQSLAPDQRAAVELVLRRGLSYGELANLLGLPEDEVRARARAGLEALAPDLPPPARAGEVADWLLGQQAPAHAARTQALVNADPAIRGWAEQVAPPLRELSDDVPDLDAELPPPREPGTGRPRPLRDAAATGGVAAAATGGEAARGRAAATGGEAARSDAAATGGDAARGRAAATGGDAARGRAAATGGDAAQPAAPATGRRLRRRAPRDEAAAAPAAGEAAVAPGRSSRLGGAILIALAVIVVGGVIAFVLTRHGDGGNAPSAATTPAATAGATATATATGNDIVLRGPAGSQAVGVMQLFRAKDNTVRFLLVAQGLPANRTGQRYSIWFSKSSGAAQLLGDVKDPVGKDGKLTAAGPGNADVSRFPSWFASYDNVLVTLDGKGARKPGQVLLSGDLPHAASGG